MERLCLALSLAMGTAATAQRIPEVEPNNSTAQATPMVPGAEYYGELSGGLFVPADTDYYSITVDGPSDILIRRTHRGDPTNRIDLTVLSLIGQASQSGYRLVAFAPSAGTYFISVRPDVIVQSPMGNIFDSGMYALDVVIAPAGTIGVTDCDVFAEPTESEPNDTPATASPLACCDDVFGSIQSPGDVDHYTFTIVENSYYGVLGLMQTRDDASGGNSIADTRLELRNAAGQLIQLDDNSGPGLHAQIIRGLGAATYTLKVEGVGGATGDYRLRFDCYAEPENSSFDGDSSGCVGSSGQPMTVALRAGEDPRIGTTFTFEVTDPAPGAVMLLGIAPIEPVIDLGFLGASGCPFSVNVLAGLPIDPVHPGRGETGFAISGDPGQICATIYMMAAAVDPGANPFGVITSNRAIAELNADN